MCVCVRVWLCVCDALISFGGGVGLCDSYHPQSRAEGVFKRNTSSLKVVAHGN